MKKYLLFTLIICLIFVLSSCKNNDVVLSSNSSVDSNLQMTDSTESEGTIENETDIHSNKNEVSSNKNSNTIEPNSSNHTHNYINGTITKKPTCEEQGIKTYYCSSCSSTKIECIDALNHKWEDATCTSPKSCSLCNKIEGKALEHTYSNNICNSCSKEKIAFNYSRVPAKISASYGDLNITSIDMKFKNEELYAKLNFTVVKENVYAAEIKFKLVSSKGEQVSAHKIIIANNYYVGESYSYEERILSWDGYLKLEEGEYYISIS